MDINAVSRALHALNMMYQSRFYALGIARTLSHYRKPKAVIGFFTRQALRRKAQAIVEHDRVLTGR